ncbi:LIC_12616 family protein [Marinibaculum pumilum]|uniref:LIC_12616 family protein n=1 Tax=Marinibaculum pumilum TaxID=1766165 RepID=A0ABV7KY70_9PROT
MMASQTWAAVRLWGVAELGAAVTEVIRADQNAPRPATPFATVKVLADAPVGHAHIADVDDDGIVRIGQDSELTVSLQVFGGEAMDLAQALQRSLDRTTVQEDFRRAGLVYVDLLTPVSDTTAVTGSGFESRAQFDLRFRTATEITDDVGLIETVIGTGTINGVSTPYEVTI